MAEFGEQFYEEDEAEQILRLAASFSTPAGRMSRERLLATAAELGITPEAVEMAERRLSQKQAEITEQRAFDADQRKDFYAHLLTYGLVNAFLAIINIVTSPYYFWEIWVLLCWGLGLAFHWAETFLKRSEGYQEEFDKWRGKRQRRLAVENAEREVIGSSDFVIDKYVHKRMGRGRDVSKLEAIHYLMEKSGLDLRSAKEAVEQYIMRNPGVMD